MLTRDEKKLLQFLTDLRGNVGLCERLEELEMEVDNKAETAMVMRDEYPALTLAERKQYRDEIEAHQTAYEDWLGIARILAKVKEFLQ